MDEDVTPEVVAACPITATETALPNIANRTIRRGPDLFAPERSNSEGFDLTDAETLARIDAARDPHATTSFAAVPMIAGKAGQPNALSPTPRPGVKSVTRD